MKNLKMQTTNMVDENIKKIGELFPNCLTETINADGKLVRAIDFDKLRQELACEVVEGAEERYQFTWPDKRNAIRLANAPINKTLRPCREESVDFDNTKNLYIEGDNLEVLKLLRENYLGKVKMIYIDPPYNTGNDFVYNDDFAQGKAEFEAQSGLYDEVGNRMADPMVQNTERNGRFHTDWLNMIYPRLKVAKDLLSNDGMIFISIDEHESHNLRKICDEIFGSHNFISQITWEKRYTRSNNAKRFTTLTEPLLCYVKDSTVVLDIKEKRNEKADSIYTNPDNDPRGVWTSVSYVNPATKEQRPNLSYPLFNPFLNKEVIHPTNAWKYEKSTYEQHLKENRLYWGKNGENIYPRLKKFLYEMDGGMVPVDLWKYEEAGSTDLASKELECLIGRKIFDFPKPKELIIRILSLIINSKTDSNFMVLDFFSGSATTAHAVMQLNAEDGGNRKFIMVQLPEKTDEKSEAYKAGYKNICEIGKERIRRAGKKVKEEAGLQGQNLDTGFRVLKLDESNMADVYYTPADTPIQTTLVFDALVDNIREGRTAEDLLFQVLPECNLPLSSKIEIREIHGKKVFVVEDGYLIACFDKDINESVITAIAKEKPYYFVMCDRSIATDNVADNFDQIFNAYNKETIRRIL
ncbi:MAG: site-specific DNA-methyltransferase [Bacteroidales bacterium]|nr:site-specific DNA-methyltransferase [Bacteroidales bacterium]